MVKKKEILKWVIKTTDDYDKAILRHNELNDKSINEYCRKDELDEFAQLKEAIEGYEKQFPFGVKIIPKACPWRRLHPEKPKELKLELQRPGGFYVYCTQCKTHGPFGKDDGDAVTKWNQR